MSRSTPASRAGVSAFHAVAIALVCAASAHAQSFPQLREGFTLSAGVGAGVASVQCAVCDSGGGIAAYARIGGALHRNLILAGEVSSWRRAGTAVSASQSDIRVQLSTVAMVVQWYPRVEQGFFVDTGLGVGILETRISDRETGVSYRSGVSGGYQLGVGYDYRVKKDLSVTPYATFFGAASSHMTDNSGTVHGNALQVGLGLTKH